MVGLLTEQNLDALLYPTIRQTARPIGQGQPGSACQLSAVSGLPAITVPAGFAQDDMPVGLELLGAPWSEPTLIGLAYAFEQATHHRRPPDFTPSLIDPPAPVDLVGPAIPASGEAGEMELVFEPTTHVLRYRIALDALQPADVLSIDLHRSSEDSDVGPVVRHLDAGKNAIVGEVSLGGQEVHLLREGHMYLDIHTREQLTGMLRIDLGPLSPGA